MSLSRQRIALLEGNKKGHPARGALKSEPVPSLTQPKQIRAALVELQNERFRQESRQNADLIDWLIWMYPGHAPMLVHRIVDRLMLGDQQLAIDLSSIRKEMGL